MFFPKSIFIRNVSQAVKSVEDHSTSNILSFWGKIRTIDLLPRIKIDIKVELILDLILIFIFAKTYPKISY